ncbi:MAG: lactonase family protein [Planctomycetota bacterium]|nr:MAG: lactonase family protein [Planctomycetota bacterium]REJ92220.1 MAG: lactonase family protein [Planctomycetota bacterium]REK27380.1 MAG: lactonase family protein [Planctomycetota bacterium]REK36599.1 MAG: lactonase family protein [Planctomycetota bacterium]
MSIKNSLPIQSCAAVLLAACTFNSSAQSADEPTKFLAFVGTYTGGDSEGIYAFDFDAETGKASTVRLVAETKNPSFLAIHPSRKFLYAVSELPEGGGAVAAFSIDDSSGNLSPLSKSSTIGGGPCHLVVDAGGRFVLVANYGGGSVCSIPIKEDGGVGEAVSFVQHEGSSVNPQRQAAPHAHSINLDHNNRFAVAADLGLDKLLVYQFDSETGELKPNDPPFAAVEPGSGPRHFTFHPSGEFAYVINEITLTATAFRYDDEHGILDPIQTISTIPGDVEEGFSTAEIVAHPSGKFVYGSNRGHDTIVVFRVDEESGMLERVENESTQGNTPRNFALDPTGNFLFAENQASDTVVVFRIDEETGELDATGDVIEVPSPVCIRMMPAGE